MLYQAVYILTWSNFHNTKSHLRLSANTSPISNKLHQTPYDLDLEFLLCGYQSDIYFISESRSFKIPCGSNCFSHSSLATNITSCSRNLQVGRFLRLQLVFIFYHQPESPRPTCCTKYAAYITQTLIW